MARFALVGPAYRSQSVIADCQILMNLYLEAIESGQGKSAAALYRTPGLLKLYDLGQVGSRGIITEQTQKRTFVVSGTNFYELLAPTANPNKILRGQVVSDGQPVSMAFGPTQVLIASGGNLYCFQLVDGTTTNATGATLPKNTLTQIPLYDNATGYGLLGPVAEVSYGKGFFVVQLANSNQLQNSNPLDGSSWQGVAQAEVSVFPGNIVGIYVDHGILWVFGAAATQPYFLSGNFPFPWDVIEGGFIEQGLAAPFSVAKLDNSIFWLGGSERGGLFVWRANGYQPVRISTHAIEYELSTYATIADAVCFAYEDQGHTVYQMNFPTAQKTWCYDCATQSWFQKGYWNSQAGIFTQHRAGFHTFNFGMHLVADPSNGSVYQQSINVFSDFGSPIRRVRRAPHISKEQSRIFHIELQLDVEVGLGPTFQGSDVPTLVPMLDANGVLRNFQMQENGILAAPVVPGGDVSTAQNLFLNDPAGQTSWQITISGAGAIVATQLTNFVDSYPAAIPFVTMPEGDQRWSLQIQNIGGGLGIPQAIPQGMVGRGPVIELRWSNDGAKTFSDPRMLDCGQAGDTLRRVITRQLGSGRDRVYEISMTDAADWKIIDAHLFTDPEDREPVSRLASEMRKRA